MRRRARLHRPARAVAGNAPREVCLALGDAHTLTVTARPDGAAAIALRDADGRAHVTLEIALTAQGPVLRASAPSLELSAERDVVVRCERFGVEAQGDVVLSACGDVRLQAGGAAQTDAARVDVRASPGAVRLTANDDVQLIGEQVLLNCDRPPPVPAWVPRVAPVAPTLAAAAASGDAELVAALLGAPGDDTRG